MREGEARRKGEGWVVVVVGGGGPYDSDTKSVRVQNVKMYIALK